MPLRDHFHPPVRNLLPWPSLHSGWIGRLTERLNALMPPGFVALDRMYVDGGLEIDIGAAERDDLVRSDEANGSGGTAVATARAVYTPPAATASTPFQFPDLSEVRVFTDRGEGKLVGAVELVSPGNKESPDKREGFTAKCVDYLASGASLVVVDVVTERHANLHNEIVRRFDAPATLELPDETYIYATAYRPVVRRKKTQIDIWVNPLKIDDPLPTMPLRLIADYFVPVELEVTYTETCRGRKLL